MGTVNAIISQLAVVPHKVIWPIHPRILKWKSEINLPSNVVLVEPLSYIEMLRVLDACTYVLTDSGGLQKEAYWAKKQCFTFRNDTEWVETLVGGWNTLIEVKPNALASKITATPSSEWKPIYGDGNASKKIADAITTHFKNK